MLLTQAVAHEPDVGLGSGSVGRGRWGRGAGSGSGSGSGFGPPPPLPLVKGWNAWVKAPSDWVIPLQVDDAVVSPGQPSLSRPSAQNESQAMPCWAA